VSCQPLRAVDPVRAACTVTDTALDGNAISLLVRELVVARDQVDESQEMTGSSDILDQYMTRAKTMRLGEQDKSVTYWIVCTEGEGVLVGEGENVRVLVGLLRSAFPKRSALRHVSHSPLNPCSLPKSRLTHSRGSFR